MSVMQATSVAFETSCNFCLAVRRQVVTTLKPIFDGIVLGSAAQNKLSGRSAARRQRRLQRHDRRRGRKSTQREDDLNLPHEERRQTLLFAFIVKGGPTLSFSFLPTL